MKKKLVIGKDPGFIEKDSYIELLPGKIIAVGLNYREHAKELKMPVKEEPVIFLKPNTSVIGHEESIVYPAMSSQVDYEAELAVIIKKKAKNLHENNVKDHILGYTCANDVTARDLQKRDGQWTRAKSFDSFCPLGPIITDEIDPNDLMIRSYLNDKIKQDSRTSDMIFKVEQVIAFISSVMTLFPGDVILTGTPYGVGEMRSGDSIEIEIEGIGKLINKVR